MNKQSAIFIFLSLAGCNLLLTPECGDKIINAGEECDDGGFEEGDGCTPTCKREAPCNEDAHFGASSFDNDPETGNCFAAFLDALPWVEAEENCELQGGHLAVIDSSVENQLVKDLVNGAVWIGINDIEEEAEDDPFGWVKVTGGRITFNGFNIGEPNNIDDEDCARLVPSNEGRWIDEDCEGSSDYVCEFAADPCGDGITHAAFREECDDGNDARGDGCRPDCTAER